MLKLGDFVKPKPEWTVPPFNVIPSGRIEGFGMNGQAVYVNGRAIATYVLDLVENPTDEQLSASKPTPAKPEPAKPTQADMFAQNR